MRETYLSILGYPYAPYDGQDRWHADIPGQDLLTAVQALPTEEGAFLGTDLESDTAAQAVAALVSQDRFAAIKDFQCERIRSLRSTAYQAEADGLFFGYEADGDSRDTWLNKRTQIKDRYPWPWHIPMSSIQAASRIYERRDQWRLFQTTIESLTCWRESTTSWPKWKARPR